MEDLKLPIIDFDLPAGEPLSMEEYAEFCLLCLKADFNRKEYERQKKKRCVTVPFHIIENSK